MIFSLYSFIFLFMSLLFIHPDCFLRESCSCLWYYISSAKIIMKNTFHNDNYFSRSSLVMAFFFINEATLLPNWQLPKLHQNQVRNQADAPSKAMLCSRLDKVICWITLPAPVTLISGFHVRDFWCPQTFKLI